MAFRETKYADGSIKREPIDMTESFKAGKGSARRKENLKLIHANWPLNGCNNPMGNAKENKSKSA
jgi:hypothetical protein